MGREYASLFHTVHGGLAIVARVNNTAAALNAWLEFASARAGYSVSIVTLPPPADANDDEIWLFQDVIPQDGGLVGLEGLDATSVLPVRDAIYTLVNANQTGLPSDTTPEGISVTGLFGVPEIESFFGMLSFATVFDDDPTKYLVMAVNQFDRFFQVGNMSPSRAFFSSLHSSTCAGG